MTLLGSKLRRIVVISLLLSIFSIKAIASNYYWVGGSGNWSDLNHWATTSGGTTLHTQIPTALDDVFFDAGSGFTAASKTVTINASTAFCHNMDWTGASNNPALAGNYLNTLNVYGSLVPSLLPIGLPLRFNACTLHMKSHK